MSKFLFKKFRTLSFNSLNKHVISIERIFEIIRLTVIEILAIINWYSKIAVSNRPYCLLTDVNTANSDVNFDAFSLYQNGAVISSILRECINADGPDGGHFEHHLWPWLLCAVADCSLTSIVSFWKIAFLVCRWKQIISPSWNWTRIQFSTQCSNGCQCVLCNFQWFLFSIMSVGVLYLGGRFFGTHCRPVRHFIGVDLECNCTDARV